MKDAPTLDHPEAGFTLVELVVVLAILAMTIALTFPRIRFPGQAKSTHLSASELTVLLANARAAALRNAATQLVSFDPASKTFQYKRSFVSLSPATAVTVTTAGRFTRSSGDLTIAFFPDGSSSGGRVVMTHGLQACTLQVSWLTGTVSRDGCSL